MQIMQLIRNNRLHCVAFSLAPLVLLTANNRRPCRKDNIIRYRTRAILSCNTSVPAAHRWKLSRSDLKWSIMPAAHNEG